MNLERPVAPSAPAPAPATAASVLTDGLPLPRLVVFDLDYTLWPFWVDTHVSPPLKPAPSSSSPPSSRPPSPDYPVLISSSSSTNTSSGSASCTPVIDRHGESFSFYHDVPAILLALRDTSISIAAASRTHAPDLGRELLRLLRIQSPLSSSSSPSPVRAIDLFDALEIYPGDKRRHLRALQAATRVPFADMLFFDDEPRNRCVEALGVDMCLVPDGLDWAVFEAAVRGWRNKCALGG